MKGTYIMLMKCRIQAVVVCDHRSNGTDTSRHILQFEHVSKDRVCPASVVFDFLPMSDKKELDMRRQTRYTQSDFFCHKTVYAQPLSYSTSYRCQIRKSWACGDKLDTHEPISFVATSCFESVIASKLAFL